VQLYRGRDRIEGAGARLVVIGQGNPAQANHFRETQKVEDLPILVDPDRRTYKLAGTKVATFGELLGPRVVRKGLRPSVEEKVHQGKTVGHAAQLGGTVLVLPDGTVPWTHLADDASDNATVDDIVAAVEKHA
jgi:hypothetical protein